MSNKDKATYNAYMNGYMKLRYARRRSEAIESLGGECTQCGSSENLELDHINPDEKDFTMARGASFSQSRWEEELSKCQLLCSSCHKLKHQSKYPCGTPQRYWRGCRCDLCKKAVAEYSKVYKAKSSEHLKGNL